MNYIIQIINGLLIEFNKHKIIFIVMFLINIVIVYLVLNNKHIQIISNFNLDYQQFLNESKNIKEIYFESLIQNTYLNQYFKNSGYDLNINYLSNILCYIMPIFNSICIIVFYNLEFKNKTYLVLLNHNRLKSCCYNKVIIISILFILNLMSIIVISYLFQIKTINEINNLIVDFESFNTLIPVFDFDLSLCLFYLLMYITYTIILTNIIYFTHNIFYPVIFISIQILCLILSKKGHLFYLIINYCSLLINDGPYTLININFELTNHKYSLYLILIIILLISCVFSIIIMYFKKIRINDE